MLWLFAAFTLIGINAITTLAFNPEGFTNHQTEFATPDQEMADVPFLKAESGIDFEFSTFFLPSKLQIKKLSIPGLPVQYRLPFTKLVPRELISPPPKV